jgi:hypothetical protein
MHFILLGKSGDGKTRGIFDVAREFFTIYTECVPEEDERTDTTKDKLYGKFASDVESEMNTLPEEADRYAVVQNRFLIDVAARVLYLRLLTLQYPGVTPQQYLAAQLNGGREVTERIRFLLLARKPQSKLLDELIYW